MITTSSAFASSLAATNFAPLVNIINGNALLLVGGLNAFCINKLAHHIFGVKKDSNASYAIKAVAFVVGVTASFCIAPQAAIFAFTIPQAALFASTMNKALIIYLVFCAGVATKKKPIIGGELALIPFVGLFGRVALISVGTAAAGFGAIV